MTNQVCITNTDNASWETSVTNARLVPSILSNPAFISYSDGRCWTFDGTQDITSAWSTSTTFIFYHYSDRIFYPCETWPAHTIDAEAVVTPLSTNGDNVTSLAITPGMFSNLYYCPSELLVAAPLSFNLLSWSSSGQTVALTVLLNTCFPPVRGLTAFLNSSTWNYTLEFTSVNSTNQLTPGSNVTQIAFIPGSHIAPGAAYGLTISGTFDNGTLFSSDAEVELQT